MKLGFVIFDFEVFEFDTLFGAIIINEHAIDVFQTWDINSIKEFYNKHKDDIFVGHNIEHYDNHILEAILKNKNPYKISTEIINDETRKYLNIHLNYFDIMNFHYGSLKSIECAEGKKISESKVDFNINRPLTEEEKKEVESYNLDDLDQTLDNFIHSSSEFLSRIELKNFFNLDYDVLHLSETKLSEKILNAKKIDGIENMYIEPKIYDNLRLKNKDVLDFYLSEGFRKGKNIEINLCGVKHKLGSGGIHGAVKKGRWDWALYCDVSGYYNLVMMLYDLLPRTIDEDAKKKYEYLYKYQLELKKIDPIKRAAVKVPLLAVFGSMTNEHTAFYDPNKGTLVTIVGQIFLVDLLEKLEGKIELIQSNTDGIILKPLSGISIQDIKEIVNEWEKRTGFTLKFDKVYKLYQRDVNNYFFVNENGSIHRKGEICTYYNRWQNPLEVNAFRAKEPMIIYHAIVDFFIYKKLPEQTINENLRNLRMFQFIAKQNSYDYIEYIVENINSGEIESKKIQKINRAFPSNSTDTIGKLRKIKINSNNGIKSTSKLQNIPDNVFIYNEEILSQQAVDSLIHKIDYNYYVKRSYERILEFIDIPTIKDLKL